MRTRTLALVIALGACSSPAASTAAGTSQQAFTSVDAVLLELDLAGTLTTSTPNEDEERSLIAAQLAYTVGPLNSETAAGDLSEIAISDVHSAPIPESGLYQVAYRAKLPVAWAGSSIPTTYAFSLPARTGAKEETAFAAKYGTTCVDESAGAVDRFSMFFQYRPDRTTCKLDSGDVVTVPAIVTRVPLDPTPRYPEYQRIWEDGTLDVLAIFTRAGDGSGEDDGVRAFDRFVADAGDYLRRLQPDDAKRTAADGDLGAVLPDGRLVHIASKLVGHYLVDDAAELDPWYDARTPDADLVLYNGHAGLGDNVRELMKKGQFRPHHYLLLALNGCDTFSYADATLATRRATLNPDDPKGTKYLDTVLNVMPGNFATTASTSMTFIESCVEARDAPRSYADILGLIASQPVVVVTGEEDNVFQPGMLDGADAGVATPMSIPPAPRPTSREPSPSTSGCAASPSRPGDGFFAMLVLFALMPNARRRFLGDRRSPEVAARV